MTKSEMIDALEARAAPLFAKAKLLDKGLTFMSLSDEEFVMLIAMGGEKLTVMPRGQKRMTPQRVMEVINAYRARVVTEMRDRLNE